MPLAQQLTVAYDGSPLSELALRRALRLTEGSLIGNVHVVCVGQKEGDLVRLPTGEQMTRFAALQTLRHIVGRMGSDDARSGSSAKLYVHLRSGDAARIIVDIAYRYHCELILMGAGGRGGAAAIGSVARGVLDLSDIPVELETPLTASPDTRTFNPLRIAYVFGHGALAEEKLRGGGAPSA